VDDKIKQLLRELGTAINESISASGEVNQHIQQIRDEGYDLYVVLDATISLNKQGEEVELDPDLIDAPAAEPSQAMIVKSDHEVQFRIDINDLALLRSLGIDPTRKVKSMRRVAPLTAAGDDE
jgi:hypothetical protein